MESRNKEDAAFYRHVLCIIVNVAGGQWASPEISLCYEIWASLFVTVCQTSWQASAVQDASVLHQSAVGEPSLWLRWDWNQTVPNTHTILKSLVDHTRLPYKNGEQWKSLGRQDSFFLSWANHYPVVSQVGYISVLYKMTTALNLTVPNDKDRLGPTIEIDIEVYSFYKKLLPSSKSTALKLRVRLTFPPVRVKVWCSVI